MGEAALSDRGASRSVNTYLIGLIIGVLLPLATFSGFEVTRAALHEQDVMATLARNRTRIATAAIENDIGALRGRLFLLAGRLSLQTSDLGEFHARAKESFDPMTVVLSDADGHEIVNTSRPFGEVLPDNPDIVTVRYVGETQQSRVAGLSHDPITGRPAVTINVPVTRDSQLVYILSLDISSTLPLVLRELNLPEDWVAGVFDRQGLMIARSRDPEPNIGKPALPEFLAHMRAEQEGWVPGMSREGVPLFTAFAHTRLGGWTVTAGMPREVLLAPVRRTTLFLILSGFGTLAAASALAIVIGRRIAAPIVRLVPIAEAVGRGEPVTLHQSGLTEANVVAHSLFDASERLRQSAAERETATAALSQSEQMYRSLARDLARIHEERTALLNRVVVAQESERKRIARELHDSLAQYTTALRLKVDALGRSGAFRSEALDELRSLIGEVGGAVSRMAWELRPVALDELGLRSAVGHYLEEWAEMAGLHVDVEIDLGDRTLPPAIETTLFRVLQEAATNVLRHAQATRVGVILEVRGDCVRLIVEDNGKGMTAGACRQPFAAPKQFGLLGIRERLSLVHGELDVESAPERGTTLFANIPLERERPAWSVESA